MKTALGVLATLVLAAVFVLMVVDIAPKISELRGGQPGSAPAAAGDLSELAERLVAPPFPFPDGQTQSAKLFASTLPPNAPFAMPIAPNARLIGSVLRTRGSTTSLDVVLDVPGSADDVLSFYEKQLGTQGFAAPSAPPAPQQGGFVSSIGPAAFRALCKSETGPYVSIQAYARPNLPNDVRLHWEPALGAGTSGGTPCNVKGAPGGPSTMNRLPAIKAPDGVVLRGSGGMSGGDRQESQASATTTKSPGELEAFFARQLQAAGWARVDGRDDGALAWSTWKLPGEGDFQGLLMVTSRAGSDRRSMTLRAEGASVF